VAESPNSFELLRQYMSPAVQGRMVDAVLGALATGDDLTRGNAKAIFDQLFLTSAVGRYLDRRAGNVGFLRPSGVGMLDDTFRRLAIITTARKQVTSILLHILEVFYGAESTRAFLVSAESEPYALQDGDTLSFVLDNRQEVQVIFKSSDFTDIAVATAREIASAITRRIRKYSPDALALALDYYDPSTGDTAVQVFSGSKGPTSSIRVTGGRAQNVLRFPSPALTTQTAGAPATQWNLQVQPSGEVWLTWAAGTNPSLNKTEAGNYVNIFGTGFQAVNRGSFVLKEVVDGAVNVAHVVFDNQSANNEPVPVVMAADNDVQFWISAAASILSIARPATVFEVDRHTIKAFLPATTTVTERRPKKAGYLHALASDTDFLGPYAFDPSSRFVISEVASVLGQTLDAGQTYSVVSVSDSSNFPDGTGFLVFGYGTDRQEGPVRYLARPGSAALLLDPSHQFQYSHFASEDVALVSRRGPPVLDPDGGDYQFYATGTVAGRIYAEQLLGDTAAAGITLDIEVVYPGDVGLGNAGLGAAGTRVSDEVYVWGGDPP